LIIAVVLSAVILGSIFQQSDGVTQRKPLKWLAYLWIAQNVFLMSGVIQRLWRYVDISVLTPARIYVICFVLLVAAGFALLGIYIAARKSLNWLLGTNMLATFCLFFMLQFLNVDSWVAHWNVTRCERNPLHALNLDYLKQHLGSSAWRAIARVDSAEARNFLMAIDGTSAPENWRSWQGREAANRKWLAKWKEELQ